MKRRSFITLLGGAAAWPLAAHAQQRERMRHVGALILGNADADAFRTELREGLSKAGYVEGRNVQVDIRSAQGKLELLPQ
jgi:putative ABC transport system substrate-binding protein